jgi:hypothetical protein
MAQIFRIDTDKQKLNWEKLPNGTYRAFMTLGVAGLPLEYVDAKGNKHTEIIKDEDLFNEDSLKSAYGLPICLNHPKFGNYNQNAEGKLIGHTLESFLREDSTLLMPVVVDDHRGIQLIDQMLEKGEYAEVSPGYWVESLEKSDSKESTFFQKNRTYDHLALLKSGEGRGGQNIVLRTDSELLNTDIAVSTKSLKLDDEQVISTSDQTEIETSVYTEECYDGSGTYKTEKTTIEQTMIKVTFLDKTFEVSEDVAESMNAATLQMDSKDKAIADTQKQLDTVSGQLAATKIQLDSKKGLLTLDEASEFVKQSIELWQKVEPSFKADAKDFTADYSLKPEQIKELYIRRFHPTIQLDGKSSDFIQGIWSMIESNVGQQLNNDSATDRVRSQLELLTVAEIKTDSINSEVDEAVKARKDQFDRILNSNKN